MRVIEYVTEEVSRQGHDITKVDGLERVEWMLQGWVYACRHVKAPRIVDAWMIGRMIERDKNQNGFRQCGVRVGDRICPSFEDVPRLIKALFDKRDDMNPLDFYREFEMIHPFVDGNGRTGKVLLNWLNGTLADPIFPPDDFWGESIRNP